MAHTTTIPFDPQSPLVKARAILERTLLTHWRFADALRYIESRLLYPSENNLLFIIGPTGVGKSRLFHETQKMVASHIAAGNLADADRLPCVAFEVPATTIGNFAWGPFYREYSDQLYPPLPPDKAAMPPSVRSSRDGGPDYALMQALKHRHPWITLLDEANHLCQVTSPALMRHQLDKIKSLANRSQVLHVCFGTYELAALLDASPQLARRSDIFHFGRYLWEDAKDQKAFANVVDSFNRALPVAHMIDLRSITPLLYERSIGCVGILKTWLMQAFAHACVQGHKEIKIADLHATSMEAHKLRSILLEARGNEQTLETNESDWPDFQDLLGNPPAQDELPLGDSTGVPSNKTTGRVGIRNPKRDVTGTAFATASYA